MSEQVIIALIAMTSSLLVVLVGGVVVPVLLKRVNAIRDQVANDHRNPDGTPLNLRDDLDEKHSENHGILLAIQRDVAWLMRRVAATDDRVDHLEDTARKYHPEEGATP